MWARSVAAALPAICGCCQCCTCCSVQPHFQPELRSAARRPCSRANRHQLYSVASLLPSSAASSPSGPLCGGSILRSSASLRSSEYFGTGLSLSPPVAVVLGAQMRLHYLTVIDGRRPSFLTTGWRRVVIGTRLRTGWDDTYLNKLLFGSPDLPAKTTTSASSNIRGG